MSTSLSPRRPSSFSASSIGSGEGEPSITYHTHRRSISIPNPIPDIQGMAVSGAHFSAGHDHVLEVQERELRPVSSHLSGSGEEGGGKLSDTRRRVVEDVLELFCSRPTAEIFERSWRKDAIFEDPLSKCYGYNEYAPQWFSMPVIFPQSRTLKVHVISSTYAPAEPNQIVYEQEQEYTLRWLKRKQVVKSTVVIDLDENDKIIKLEDKWSGKDQPSRWGIYYLRRLNARALPFLVKVPKQSK